MPRIRVSVSVPEEIALYLRKAPNASALVSESVRLYQAEQLRNELTAAYQADRAESAGLDSEWSDADARVPG